MIVIGLTGNIGCGKSTVARMIANLGGEVVDADQVAHAVMAPHTPVWEQVVGAFGTEILRPNGEIDRRRLAAIVFSDPAALERLERLVHPAVIARIDKIVLASSAPVVVVEAIKLIESGLDRRCDSVWVVTCTPEQQVARSTARGMSPDDVQARIASQPPVEEKIARADVVIDNSGSLEATREQVERAFRHLIQRHSGR